MVFQSYALYPHLSVYDNIAFGSHQKLRKTISTARSERVEDPRLEAFLDRKPRALSGANGSALRWDAQIVRERRCS